MTSKARFYLITCDRGLPVRACALVRASSGRVYGLDHGYQSGDSLSFSRS